MSTLTPYQKRQLGDAFRTLAEDLDKVAKKAADIVKMVAEWGNNDITMIAVKVASGVDGSVKFARMIGEVCDLPDSCGNPNCPSCRDRRPHPTPPHGVS